MINVLDQRTDSNPDVTQHHSDDLPIKPSSWVPFGLA